MRGLDLSSWESFLITLLGLALFTLIAVGVRLVVMMTIQERRQRANRQINERLKVLIAAYKVLGGSFTGDLSVDPTHLRDLRRARAEEGEASGLGDDEGSNRGRRIRDAVEAALSDVILLGTEDQVRLARRAALDLVAGRPVHTHELVVSLRDFVRKALDLDPIPADLDIPLQGPTRPSGSGDRGERGKGDGRSGGGQGVGADGGGAGATGGGEPTTSAPTSSMS